MFRLALAGALFVFSGAGCASAPRIGFAGAVEDEAIFGVPPSAVGTQTLYQVQVDDANGRSSLRLVLRLWTASRFEIAASDPFGRSLWRLVIRESAGYWIEGRGEEVCRLDPERSLRWPRLALVLPAAELPALLLGRLPEPPGEGAAVDSGGSRIVDRSGRTWEIERDGEGLASWSLGAGGSRLEWHREAGGGRLDLGGGEIRIGWRGVRREPAAGTAPALPVGSSSAPECRLEELS